MMDDTPIIITVVTSVHVVPSAWAEEYREGFTTREQVMADVRQAFSVDPTTGTTQRVAHVRDDGPAFPRGMHGTTTGPMLVNWSVTDPQ